MFEKEAEEYAENREVCGLLDAISENLQNYDYGTVAHYNIDPLVEECFKDGAEFGYNKANEWHKVADEGLPINKNDGATYLLYTIYGEGGSPVVAYFVYRDKKELRNVWTGAILTEDKIVAWKEIVLPKEIKEND